MKIGSATAIAIIISLLLSLAAFAGYTPAEWERLKKGEVIVSDVSGQNPDGSQRIEFLAKIYVKASRENCWKIIRDYNRFSEFMPKLRKCTILKREGEVYYVEYEAKVAFITAKYHLRLDGVESNSNSTAPSRTASAIQTGTGCLKTLPTAPAQS